MADTPEPLADFLRRTRAAALDILRDPSRSDAAHLTLIMGNEAGDLDSLASAIALSYLLTHLPHPAPTASASTTTAAQQQPEAMHTVYAPLIQTAHADLYLRPENEVICRFAGIDSSDAGVLLTIDALEAPAEGGGEEGLVVVVPDSLRMDLASDPRLRAGGKVSFGLVDHAALIPRWGPHEHREVRYLVDHHKDEGAHPNAFIRYLRGPGSVPAGEPPIGSASSLVAELFQDELIKAASRPAGSVLPKGIADLLISAIVIDTDNLRPAPRGRATARDVLSHALLLPLSSFGPASSGLAESNAAESGTAPLGGPDHGRGGSASSGQGQTTNGNKGISQASSGAGSQGGSGQGASIPGAQLKDENPDGSSECDCQAESIASEVEEPAIFSMCEDVEMDLEESKPEPSQAQDIPACPHPHHQEHFKARCDSEASTAGACRGGRPKVSAERPCGNLMDLDGEQGKDEDEEDDEDEDVLEQMAGRDLYKILGLKRGVEQVQIRTAYRREALKCHPDRARSLRDAERRTRRFKLLVNAYEILSDPVKRRQYDLFYDPLTSGVSGMGGSGTNTPGAGTSYTSSSTFSNSYSSSYTSSSFFDTYGSSFSSFGSSPPPHGRGAFSSADWKYETYEQLKAEELTRTETRTVAESLFTQRRPSPDSKSGSDIPKYRGGIQATRPESLMTMSDTIVFQPPVSIDLSASKEQPKPFGHGETSLKTPTALSSSATVGASVPTSTTAAAPGPQQVASTAPPRKQFSFVWESPAESLRRARARPGGGAAASGQPTAAASSRGMLAVGSQGGEGSSGAGGRFALTDK
ncbi:hypothetical protein V8E36_000774 [Tilletia maclaganii]